MELSKEQGQYIKGISILLIIIHNFADHLMCINSNETTYSEDTTQIFLDHLFTTDAIWYIFSYAGWIGVPLFFFLSGFGLTKKYSDVINLNPCSFLLNHIVKLWMLLIPIYLIYFTLFTTNIKSAIAQLTFSINILYDDKSGFYMDPGVYWFFGAILQFYLLFLLLRKINTRWLWVLFALFGAIHFFILYSVDLSTMRLMRRNFPGWGTSFVMGMIAARSRIDINRRTNVFICVVSFMGLCASLIIKWLTPFVEICSIVFIVSLTSQTIKWTSKCFYFIGIISPSIFVLHPLIRQIFYILFPTGSDYPYLVTASFVVITILLCLVHHKILKNINRIFQLS